MTFNNYYQLIFLLVFACIVEVSHANNEDREFSVSINGTDIQLVTLAPECISPEEHNRLDLSFLSKSYPIEKSCLYQTSSVDTVSFRDSEAASNWYGSNQQANQFSLFFFFHSPFTPAEFLTREKPYIEYTKGVHCHTRFEAAMELYLTSCQPEAPEVATGELHYHGEMWLQPPAECTNQENHLGTMITLKPLAVADSKIFTVSMFNQAIMHIGKKTVTPDLEIFGLSAEKSRQNKLRLLEQYMLQDTNRLIQINGMFSCCFSCFRTRPQSQLQSSHITVRTWDTRTVHHQSSGDGSGFSRQNSVRSSTSTNPRPLTPGPGPRKNSPDQKAPPGNTKHSTSV